MGQNDHWGSWVLFLIQFSVMGGAMFLVCCLRPHYGGGNEENSDSFKRSRAHTAALSALTLRQATSGPTPPPEIPGHSEASLGQSPGGSLLLSPRSWCI